MGEIVFNLLSRDGKINPSRSSTQISDWFYDADTRTFVAKQGSGWDGGWRHFQSDLADVLVIYNTADQRAFYDLTHEMIVNSYLGPELLFEVAKSYVRIDMAFYSTGDWLHRYIHRQAMRVREEFGLGLYGRRGKK